MERVQKTIANAGVASRREAEEWVAEGRVTINGLRATLGDRAEPGDDIRIDDRPLPNVTDRIYLMLNKPVGYTTTRRDPHARKTVMDLLRDVPAPVYPVGRLDRDSEGLLLFTNDGEFANRLTHPRYKAPKAYEAMVEGVIDTEKVRTLREGVVLEDGLTLPAAVKVIATRDEWEGEGPRSLLRITLREGRKRQIRRMCEAVGHRVLELRRTRVGEIVLGGLPSGKWRLLSAEEVWSLLSTSWDEGEEGVEKAVPNEWRERNRDRGGRDDVRRRDDEAQHREADAPAEPGAIGLTGLRIRLDPDAVARLGRRTARNEARHPRDTRRGPETDRSEEER